MQTKHNSFLAQREVYYEYELQPMVCQINLSAALMTTIKSPRVGGWVEIKRDRVVQNKRINSKSN